MKLANVYIEHSSLSLDQCFSYSFEGMNVLPGTRVWVPFRSMKLIGFVDSLSEISDEEVQRLSYQIRPVLSVIDEKPLLTEELMTLGKWMAQYYGAPTISCYQSMLPKVLRPKQNKAKIVMEKIAVYDHSCEGLTIKQKNVLGAFSECSPMLLSEFRKKYKTIANKLIEIGCVRVELREKQSCRIVRVKKDSFVQLTDQQQHALKQLHEHEDHEIIVLHGVTGSGKSEVFLRYASEMVAQGKQVLFLVPEISLTPQMQRLVEERFGNQVAIYHSQLNDQEKYEQYQLVARGEVSVVVGTRSAVFMPFCQLGAIILDEEHDLSYKQENPPRYHCREIAVWRARFHNCKVILASATPSLESYARAYKGVYRLIEMPKRIHQQLPEVEVVDMGECIRRGENRILSQCLHDAINSCLQRHEQVILLLNRRGYTTVMRCLDCGETLLCPHCEVALSYHKDENRMKCHICGYSQILPESCPSCHSRNWRSLGAGTQRLQEYIEQCFPHAKVIRMDSDATRRKGAHERLLSDFAAGADILLGTQMIAKGLDFENVTLVGVVNADASLKSSDYRSSELTYDLLEQACGRSGRGSKKGRVILQAFDCSHYAIQCAAQHDYHRFFAKEMRYRHLAQYPPYTYLSAAYFIHSKEDVARRGADAALRLLNDVRGCKVLGPIALGKQKDEYRYRIILKGKNREAQASILRKIFECHRESRQPSRMEIDTDLLLSD